MKNITLIGSTGSIGKQVLNVVRRHKDKFNIISISAGNNVELFKSQVEEFKPIVATCAKEIDVKDYKNTSFFFGEESFTNAIIEKADIVVVALVGFKGIIAVLEAINKGKDVALANKESLVVGGDIVIKRAKEKGVKILPIDSEHSAIWQALDFDFNKPFKKIILTASGGAFRDFSYEQMKNVSAKEALKHPNWDMGNKITIDCATLVNKAFEVIEARWLYNADYSQITSVIHRESIIHSLVEFNDNSVIAQMSYPSMELPITLALNYPHRIDSGVDSLDFASLRSLTFAEIDKKKYPCFDLVIESAKRGGGYPAVANGANERAVQLFLEGRVKYFDIYKSIEESLNAYNDNYDGSFESLCSANEYAVNKVNKIFGV